MRKNYEKIPKTKQSNISIQNFDQLISNINQLQMEQNIRTEINELVKQFKEEAEKETKNPSKLRQILGKISGKSADAGIMVFRFAIESGLLEHLLSG